MKNRDKSMKQTDLENCKALRKRIFTVAYSGGMGHLASCFSAVEIIYTLIVKGAMKCDSKNPTFVNRDRFVLSKGHGGLALYTALEMAGFISKEDVDSYLKENAVIGGEPNIGDTVGIEASTGSLGHGLSMAVGMAIAQKLDGKGARTFCLIGDGESQEGTIWEAAMAASSFELENLVGILDCNALQKSSRIDETMKYISWEEKWKAFGWNVIVCDGHDVDELYKAFTLLPSNGKPTIVIANTIKGKGVSIMEGVPKWHFKMPNKKELKVILEELEISENELEV